MAGLIGVAILHGDGIGFEGGQGQAGRGLASCYVLARLSATDCRRLVARRLPADAPPLGTATFQMLASAAMMTVVAGLVDRPWQLPMPGLTTWLAVIGLAALSTALAYIVFFQIMQRSGATNVMLVTLLIPVTAILLGYLMLGEKISAQEIVGRAGDRQRAAVDRRAGAEGLSATGKGPMAIHSKSVSSYRMIRGPGSGD